jgi:hypothetical protein
MKTEDPIRLVSMAAPVLVRGGKGGRLFWRKDPS